ncbi:MAG: hypothetical protein ABIP79_07415 [Chitinophagaceae bacterium]
MKWFGITVFVLISSIAYSQSDLFPSEFVGNWKGELLWYKTGKPAPQKVNMELRIQPADSTDSYTWQLIYGSKEEDYRPYILKPINKAEGHWVIDELSGIVLDQFWVGNKFSGAFSVQKSTILNSYWVKDDKMYVEFFNIGVDPLITTGKGTEQVPFVNSYKLGSYQKAVLMRAN